MSTFLNSHGIKTRLILGFIIVPILMVALSFIGINEVNRIDESLYKINELTSVKQRYAINFRGSVHDRAISLRDIILNTDVYEIEKSKNEIKKLEEFYAQSAKEMQVIISEHGLSQDEKELLKNINEIENKTMPIIYQTIKAKEQKDESTALKIMLTEAKPLFINWLSAINKFIDHQESLNTKDAFAAREIAAGFQKFIIILTLIALILAIVIGYFLIRSITNPLNTVANKIEYTSTSITDISEDISKSSQSLANGASTQASSIEHISSAVEEMNQIVEQNVTLTNNASQMALESRASAKEGEIVIGNMIHAIKEIDQSNTQIMEQIDSSNKQITAIINVIQEIAEKTKVINDIVFQTKLLSFNASVEAARAGEHGKGFAVVAEEVGKLAQMSGNAALEISTMLTNSGHKVDAIVNETKEKVSVLIEKGRQKVETGNEVATQCSLVLKDIVTKVNSVTEINNEVSKSLNEQKIGFAQITSNVLEMDKVTQTNSKLAIKNANTIESLNHQTQEMNNAFIELSSLLGRKN